MIACSKKLTGSCLTASRLAGFRHTGQFGVDAHQVRRQPLQPECPHGSATGGSIGSMHIGQSSPLSAISAAAPPGPLLEALGWALPGSARRVACGRLYVCSNLWLAGYGLRYAACRCRHPPMAC